MKKIIIKLLIFVFTFSVFTCAIYNDDHSGHEEGLLHFHVHHLLAYEPGDAYDTCSDCGTGTLRVLDVFKNPTCTDSGELFVMCDNCGYAMYAYPASLGHNYEKETIIIEATCTHTGIMRISCTRCGDVLGEETIDALGHNYLYRVTKEATCTEEGIRTYTCTRCGGAYTRAIEALGHDIEYEEKEATCTEDGYKKGVCKRCGEESVEVFKALGHKPGAYKTIKEATCTSEGLKQAICEVCNETIEEKIEKLGHKYPEEWTMEKESSYFAEGLKSKECERCHEKISEIIPKKDPTILIAGGIFGIAALGAAAFIFAGAGKKKWFRKKKKQVDNEALKPDFEDKTLVVCSDDEELIKALKARKYLVVNTCDDEQLLDCVEENEPDLIIYEVKDEEQFKKIIKLIDKDFEDKTLGLIVNGEIYTRHNRKLKNLKADKKIIDYELKGSDIEGIMVRMILPVLKPKMNSDETLGNIGMVADALGIPGISTIIDLYVTGRDIKATLEEEEKGVNEYATLIGDIASILGFDQIASVAGLVDDIDSIKSALDKESGMNEKSAGIDGAKDIVEVVSDIIKKD